MTKKDDALKLARLFHTTYERLAPNFGYETRTDTKVFDPLSANGQLMLAVCSEIYCALVAQPEQESSQPEQVTHKYSLELPSGTDGKIRFAKVWWHDCKAEGNEILHRLCISVEEPKQEPALCCGEYQTCKKDCNRRHVYQALKPV